MINLRDAPAPLCIEVKEYIIEGNVNASAIVLLPDSESPTRLFSIVHESIEVILYSMK